MVLSCVVFGLASLVAPDPAFTPSPAAQRAAQAINEATLRAHTRFLADDLLEGRGPGSRGDRLAQRYIECSLQGLGLEPAAPGGGWRQVVPLIGLNAHQPAELTFARVNARVTIKQHEQFIVAAGAQRRQLELKAAEVVFVGYGIQAPEYSWDDFKGVDVRGKVLLIMNNDPAADPALFAGDTRLYYGRWDYKYEKAEELGAAGAIIIHTTASAGYPWQVVQTSWSGEQFELEGGERRKVEIRGWLTEGAARSVVELAGLDLDELRRSAQSRLFRPVPLGVELTTSVACDVRSVETANVLAQLPGRDSALASERVVITAHHDHLGLEEAGQGADRIYNGAVDNASGVAALLALAAAFRALPEPPRRTILFAAVGGEEQGLLGSAYLAAHPPVPAGKLAATLNIDGVNIWGRTRDVTLVGMGKSSLDRMVLAVAAWQGRQVKPDQFPDRGFYYRSDQFSLARVGVPGIYLDGGLDFLGRSPGWGKEQVEAWEAARYHQPSDEYSETWDLSGAVEDVQLLFHAGLEVANSNDLPEWAPGDEFRAAREAALRAVR